MCDRFTLLKRFEELAAFYDARPFGGEEWRENYNIAPTRMIPVIVEEPEGRELRLMKWGLIPFWAKAEKIALSMINAPAETLTEKPGFRDSFKDKRCIIPASGFYEWQKLMTAKKPYYVTRDAGLFSFAGLWSRWVSPDSIEVESCAIITGAANALVKPVSDRMPVALPSGNWSAWLAKKTKAPELLDMLTPMPVTGMTIFPVSPAVNKASSQGPKCIAPLGAPA